MGVSHNVLAVKDGLQARISKCEAFAGLANCGWSVALWVECCVGASEATDLATRNPSREAAYFNSPVEGAEKVFWANFSLFFV
jgi:hypothetical protein